MLWWERSRLKWKLDKAGCCWAPDPESHRLTAPLNYIPHTKGALCSFREIVLIRSALTDQFNHKQMNWTNSLHCHVWIHTEYWMKLTLKNNTVSDLLSLYALCVGWTLLLSMSNSIVLDTGCIDVTCSQETFVIFKGKEQLTIKVTGFFTLSKERFIVTWPQSLTQSCQTVSCEVSCDVGEVPKLQLPLKTNLCTIVPNQLKGKSTNFTHLGVLTGLWEFYCTWGKKQSEAFCGSRRSWMWSDELPPVMSLSVWDEVPSSEKWSAGPACLLLDTFQLILDSLKTNDQNLRYFLRVFLFLYCILRPCAWWFCGINKLHQVSACLFAMSTYGQEMPYM